MINIVGILSTATAFMLGLLFLTSKSKNNKANLFLGLFLWSLTSEVLDTFIDSQNLGFSIITTSLLTLPFLFLYVVKTLNYNIKLRYALLTIPFLTEFTGIVPNFFYYAFNIFLLFYILKILKKHQQNLGDFYSDTENKTLSWIKTIVYIYLFFHFFWITEDLVGLQFAFIVPYFAKASSILTLLMIYWIGHNGFSQPEIFNTFILASEKESIDTSEQIPNKELIEQTEHPTIEQIEDDSIVFFEQINRKIRTNKLFLQKEITVRSLSKQLKISEKELSKLINTHTEKNFYHYINQFRVEEFKRLLQTPKAEQLSLLGLSEEAGFNSKSTFYAVFKTSEGITPKQYQDQLKKSE